MSNSKTWSFTASVLLRMCFADMESHTFFGPGTKAILLIIYVYIIYFVNRRAIFIAQQYNNKDNNINASENGEASAKYCYRRIPPRTQNERLDIYIYIYTYI